MLIVLSDLFVLSSYMPYCFTHGGAGGLVVLAGFKPVAGRREAAWVGSIPTRLRQTTTHKRSPLIFLSFSFTLRSDG